MPFRLINAPASFQRFINKVLREHLNIFIIGYLDDILIFLENYNKHVGHIRKVLKKIKNARLQLKLKKYEFYVQETEFLGHWIITNEIQIDKHKIKAIQDWPEPKSIKEIQQFAGLVNYYQKYLRNYLQFIGPLFKILKKG